jgi:hypothetical protein
MRDNKSIASCHFSEPDAFKRWSAAECALALQLRGSNEVEAASVARRVELQSTAERQWSPREDLSVLRAGGFHEQG